MKQKPKEKIEEIIEIKGSNIYLFGEKQGWMFRDAGEMKKIFDKLNEIIERLNDER